MEGTHERREHRFLLTAGVFLDNEAVSSAHAVLCAPPQTFHARQDPDDWMTALYAMVHAA